MHVVNIMLRISVTYRKIICIKHKFKKLKVQRKRYRKYFKEYIFVKFLLKMSVNKYIFKS